MSHFPSATGRRWRGVQAVALGLMLASVASMPRPAAAADVDIGVSIGISRPGVYGRIDIGRYPAPVLLSPTPVWVAPPPVVPSAPPRPVAMWVPAGHRKHWRKHCHRYGACAVPVVFVQERWVHAHGPWQRSDWDDRRAGRSGAPHHPAPRDWDRDQRRGGHERGERRRGKDRDD